MAEKGQEVGKNEAEMTLLYREERRVKVIDGARTGHYVLPVYHFADCRRWRTGKPEGDCNCDCQFGALEYRHPLSGPS